MTISLTCPHCGKAYSVQDHFAGKTATCKNCSRKFRVPAAAQPAKPEVTPGGSRVMRHQSSEPGGVAAVDEERAEEIVAHVSRHVAPPGFVWHEVVSEYVHLDVHVVDPSPQFDYYTLVTTGMSDQPMTALDGSGEAGYAEMVLSLNRSWKVGQEAFRDQANYWPVEWIKRVARLPHEFQTCLAPGHTIPNGDPPEPFHPSTRMCAWLILSPAWYPDDFALLETSHARTIDFLLMVPIYREEMDYKLQHGAEALTDRLAGLPLLHLMNFDRPNVCAPEAPGIRVSAGSANTRALRAKPFGKFPLLLLLGGLGLAMILVLAVVVVAALYLPRQRGTWLDAQRSATEQTNEAQRSVADRPNDPDPDAPRQRFTPPDSRRPITPPQSTRPAPRGPYDPPESESTNVPEPAELTVGREVDVWWGSKWWPATIVAVLPNDQYTVDYDDWTANENVFRRSIRLRQAAPDDEARGEPSPSPPPQSTRPAPPGLHEPPESELTNVPEPAELTVGREVDVWWGSKWWPATIVAVLPGDQYKIHYDGWTGDEDVVRRRIRLRQTAPDAAR